jgi:UDP-GlcNAc:undecaprenyl-phosphate/decaprenyl-phosphate GlcNAc-1-phosphate transferase
MHHRNGQETERHPTLQPAAADLSLHWPQWLLYFAQFKSYFLLFLAATAATVIATPVYILIAQRLGWVDQPVGRKRHERATATMGGLVVFATVFAGALVAIRLDNLVGQMLRAKASYIYGLISCTGCMLLLGVIDDRYAVRPRVKLLVQTVVAIGAIYLGFRVEAITVPGYDSVRLPDVVGVLLSLLWIVGITNAINLSDGLDGLAAGICLLASTVNAVVAIYLGNHYMTVMMVLLAGSLLGFLRWNFHPARVFLGDTGSLALGMYLALASLHSAQKAHTVVLILIPLFALGYPIFDTLLAVARRMVRGQPLFASDRDHIHHRLLDRGGSPSAAAVSIYMASFIVSLLCIAAMTANYFVLGLGVAGVLVLALFSARVLGYLEWGGWTARWSGREETKVLHAAAALARLKIQQAKDARELARAIAIFAAEVGCREIVISHEHGEGRWTEPDGGQGGKTEGLSQLEMVLSEGLRIRYVFESAAGLDAERQELIEELSGLVGDRLVRDE